MDNTEAWFLVGYHPLRNIVKVTTKLCQWKKKTVEKRLLAIKTENILNSASSHCTVNNLLLQSFESTKSRFGVLSLINEEP